MDANGRSKKRSQSDPEKHESLSGIRVSWLPRFGWKLLQVLGAVKLSEVFGVVLSPVFIVAAMLTWHCKLVVCDITSLMAHWVWNLADLLKPVMVFLL